VSKNHSMTCVVAGLLLTSTLAGAGGGASFFPNHEPAPVFEDEDRVGKPGRFPAPAPRPAEAEAARKVPPKPTPPSPSPVITEARTAAQPAVAAAERNPPRPAPSPAPPEVAAAVPAPASGGLAAILADNYPVGLIVLALAGWVFRNTRRPARATPEIRADAAGSPAGAATGVARYLDRLGAAPGGTAARTGVARYLDRLPSAPDRRTAPETGVARYLKNRDGTPDSSGA
jgi:hypothetical protein